MTKAQCNHLQINRWPNGVFCPRCGNDKVNELATMPHKWECSVCAQRNRNNANIFQQAIRAC